MEIKYPKDHKVLLRGIILYALLEEEQYQENQKQNQNYQMRDSRLGRGAYDFQEQENH